MPQKTDLAIVLDRLPMESLAISLVTAGLELALFDEVMSGDVLMVRLLNDLLEASSTLRIERGTFASGRLDGELSGLLQADRLAAYGVAGSLQLDIRGLDSMPELTHPPDNGVPAQAGGLVAYLKPLLQRGQPTGQKDTRRFRLELEPAGTVSINGKPMWPPPLRR